MLTLWLLVTIAQAQATEEITKTNSEITTLYPVPNTTTQKDNTSPVKVNNKPYTAWNIDTMYTASNLTENDTDVTTSKEETAEKNITKEFRPSQHLGSFFDSENAEIIREPYVGPVKNPVSEFISSPKYTQKSTYKVPNEIYQTYTEFPYKFESAVYTKPKGNWHLDDSVESKPTVEIPVKVPAGGLYKSPDAFKDKPLDGEEFALDFYEDGKEISVKKRVNPWQSLLRLVTAFIPVGLIISALTPSIITIQDTGTDIHRPNPYHRSDSRVMEIAPISERCRRRLLCELHSDKNYATSSSRRLHKKHCYKVQCEDTQALWRVVRWLIDYHQPRPTGAATGLLAAPLG